MKKKNDLKKDIANFIKRAEKYNSNRTTKGGLYTAPILELEPITNRRELYNAKRKLERRKEAFKFNQQKERIVEKAYKLAGERSGELIGFKFEAAPTNRKQLPVIKKALGIYERALKKTNTKISLAKKREIAKEATKKIGRLLVQNKIIKPADMIFKPKRNPKGELSNLEHITLKAKKSSYGLEKISIIHRMLNHGGYRESYHYNMISAAETVGLTSFVNWLRESGPLMSYYLYLNDFAIPDFYELYQLGYSTAEILQKLYDALSYSLEATEDWRDDFFDDKIKTYLSELQEEINNEV